MIASFPLQKAMLARHSVDVDHWARTRNLPGWERDRVISVELCRLAEIGVEVATGVFAPGWKLQSPLWETCVIQTLSDPGNGQITYLNATELAESSQEGRHAMIVFIDTRRFPQYRMDREFAIRDTLAIATMRHLRNLCQRSVNPRQLSDLVHRIMETALKAHHPEERLQDQYSGPVQRVADFIADNLHRPIDRCELAITAMLSEGHLSRQFRMETGQSLISYLLHARLERSRELLWCKECLPIKDIRKCCGFDTESLFYTSFRRSYGMTPGEYRFANPAVPLQLPHDQNGYCFSE